MTIKPTRGKYLGRIIPDEKKIGSIHLAKTGKELRRRAKILAVGDSETDRKGKRIKSVASIGNVVYIKKYGGQELKEGLVILQNDDILGKY